MIQQKSTDESDYLPWEKGSFKVGAYLTFFDSSFGLNQEPGVKINGENILGLDSTLTSGYPGANFVGTIF